MFHRKLNVLCKVFKPTKARYFGPYKAKGSLLSLYKIFVPCSNELILGTSVHKYVFHLLTWKWGGHVTLFWWDQQYVTSVLRKFAINALLSLL